MDNDLSDNNYNLDTVCSFLSIFQMTRVNT